jgi:hypothetical protein
VYLWWTRLAGLEGLSAVGHRPGASALTLVLSGVTGAGVGQATAALEVALGVAVGLAGAALLRRRTSATGAWLGGLLAGTFAVHLAAGYLANLVFVPAFLASATMLDEGGRRSTVLAALLLGAGGLAHPLFFLIGAIVLLVAAVGAARAEPGQARSLATAVIGGGAVMGAGLLALLVGPRPPRVDTSKDAFLRRAGLTAELRGAYRDRFVQRWARYVQWVAIPLAILGSSRAEGNAGRILRAWLWVTIAGIVVALASGWIPADRFVTFGFAVPLLAALGLERIRMRLAARRLLGWSLVVALTLPMLAGSAIAWDRQEPFLSEDEVRAATIAAGIGPREGPMAFLIDAPKGEASFLASRAGNVVRASVPPDRIRDVVVVVPPRASQDEVRHALEELTAADLRSAEARAGLEAPMFVLTPFLDPVRAPEGATVVDPGLLVAGEVPDPLEPSSALEIAWASLGALLLLGVVGFGWARIGLADVVTATAASPAVGIGALILVAVALDLVGVRIGTVGGATAVSALAGGSGYLARFVLERRVGAGAPPQVHEQPAE